MTVEQLLKEKLEEEGFDGLFNFGGECGCAIDDLVPCENLCLDCEFAYRWNCNGCEKKDTCELQYEVEGFCFGTTKQGDNSK